MPEVASDDAVLEIYRQQLVPTVANLNKALGSKVVSVHLADSHPSKPAQLRISVDNSHNDARILVNDVLAQTGISAELQHTEDHVHLVVSGASEAQLHQLASNFDRAGRKHLIGSALDTMVAAMQGVGAQEARALVADAKKAHPEKVQSWTRVIDTALTNPFGRGW